MSRLGTLGARLYRGEVGYDFIGKRKIWYGISILITITAIVGLAVSGLNMGIEFKGGAVFTTPKTSVTVAEAEDLATEASGHQAIVQKLGNGGLRIQITEVDTAKSDEIKNKLSKDLDVPAEKIAADLVGPSWGEQIANKAWTGLGVFMVLVVIYLAIAFEWRMAIAALVALIHDITITVGIYALVGFEVTPGTVIGLLTILGYSLYDTVVVFDSLRESTQDITKQTRWTYSEIANRSINGTLVRSINTTVVALLPVAGLLFIGGGVLGAGMLNDISLSLFVGLAAGAYSSIFIATPLVADLKERDPQMKALKKRVLAKRAAAAAKGESAEDDPSDDGFPQDAAPAAAVVGQRQQPPGVMAGPRGSVDDQHHREHPRAPAQPDPRHPGLPEAGCAVQGHHPAARGPGGVRGPHRHPRGAVRTARRHEGRRPGGARLHSGRPGRGPGRARLRTRPQGGQAARSHAQPGVRAGVRHRRDRGPRGGPVRRRPDHGHRRRPRHRRHRRASLELIRRAGAEVAGVAVLMELGFLDGRARLEQGLADAPLEALIRV